MSAEVNAMVQTAAEAAQKMETGGIVNRAESSVAMILSPPDAEYTSDLVEASGLVSSLRACHNIKPHESLVRDCSKAVRKIMNHGLRNLSDPLELDKISSFVKEQRILRPFLCEGYLDEFLKMSRLLDNFRILTNCVDEHQAYLDGG